MTDDNVEILHPEPISEDRVTEIARDNVFPDETEFQRMRSIGRIAIRQSLIYRWFIAHEWILKFRRVKEEARAEHGNAADRFWYRGPNVIVVALTLCRCALAGEPLSKNKIAVLTGLSRPTISGIIDDAIDMGFIDDEYRPDERTQALMNDRVLEMVTHPDFVQFAKVVVMWDAISDRPLALQKAPSD
tara:strand:+ start:146 stop:709 length:564 start_codon:yes stop_codon:yes gene_type:complete